MKPLLPPVIVNGSEIAPERIAAEAQNHPAPKSKPGLAWKAAARALAIRELMLQEARNRGLRPDPQEPEPGRIETEDEALVRQLMECAVEPAAVHESDLRARYEAEPDRFRAPALYEAAHILIAAPPGDEKARTAARERAALLLAELGRHPERFADLAARHSACSSRTSGGSLGQITSGDTVPEFEAVLRSLPVGSIAPEPVQSRFGLHVVRLDARAPGEVLPFEAVVPRLRLAAEKAAWIRAARAFTQGLAARAEVSGVSLGAT